MYIEQAPLEENQKYIPVYRVGNSVSKTIAALKSFIKEEAEASPPLSAQTETEIFANGTDKYGRFRVENNLNSQGDTRILLNGSKNHNYFKEQSAPTRITIAVDEEESGEEAEHFELIDVIDDADEQRDDEVYTYSLNEKGEYKACAATQQEKEAADDDFEYTITYEPKHNSTRRESSKSVPFLGNQQPVENCRSKRRSVPAAIPISFLTEFPGLQLNQTESVPALYKTNNRPSYIPEYEQEEAEFYANNSRGRRFQQHNGFSQLECNDYIENGIEGEEEVEDSPEVANFYKENTQMGIDILQKLRKFFHLTSGSNYDSQERKRKRRSGSWTDTTDPSQHIKYRKVDNRFPKFIPKPLEDDNLGPGSPYEYLYNQRRFPVNQQQTRLSKPAYPLQFDSEMTHRGPMNSNEENSKRKSMFNAPQTTHTLVTNTTYADVEFSDDEEPEFVKSYGIGATGAHGGAGMRASKISPKVYNIPINYQQEDRAMYPEVGPTQRGDKRVGSILASSLNQDSTRKPTYAEALRQNNQMLAGEVLRPNRQVLGGKPIYIPSSAASSSASLREYNGLDNIRSNPWSTNARSILAQEKETEERERYQQLLQQVAPRIYGIENNLSAQSAKTGQHLGLSRQRSSLMVPAANSTARSSLAGNQSIGRQHLFKQPLPLSSTINLEDDNDDDDIRFTGISQARPRRPLTNGISTVLIQDDDAISDIIDLEEERDNRKEEKKEKRLPYVDPVNTLEECFKTSPMLKENWVQQWASKWDQKRKDRMKEVMEAEKLMERVKAERVAAEYDIRERLRNYRIVDPEIVVIDEFPEPDEPEFIELTADQKARIKSAICGSPDEVLISKFNLNISRRDVHTLLGTNWLNDEVINFYMNLLTDRGDRKSESHGYPRVYAMNTFFVPRLMQAGHSGVKRWTRKVDIFEKDVLPVPVHVGGVHWCMAIIHLKNCTIKYYDSMGSPSPSVLKALEQYLKDESMDKRKQPFDTSQFKIESVQDVPHQMNGSDCGVFSCMFAEYITRNKEITFTQQNMEYFRQKMVLEIVQGELLR